MQTLNKLMTLCSDGVVVKQEVAVLALSLSFMRLYLFSVNASNAKGSVRVFMIHCALIYLTSMRNIALATRRNLCLGAVGNSFLFLTHGVDKPRRCTSEPCEHSLGCDRAIAREHVSILKYTNESTVSWKRALCPI